MSNVPEAERSQHADPVAALLEDHRLIAQMTDLLERYTNQLEQHAEHGRHELVLLVTFFREFADLAHHEKEESILIPALVRAGMSWDAGPIDEVRKDHNLERYLMQSLRNASLQAKQWSEHERRHLIDIARSFIDFMRQHMVREEASLFSATRTRLSPDGLTALGQHLSRFDQAREASGDAEITRRLASELMELFASASD
jgi:hemerythrin-like domain-containing protein